MVIDSEKLNLSWFWFFASWWIDAWLGSSLTLWRLCNSEPWSLSSYLCACMVVSILLTLLNTLKTRVLLALLGQRTITHTCPVIYCFNMGWLLFFFFFSFPYTFTFYCLYLSVCLSICLSLCVCLSVCLSVCFSAYLSVGLSIYVSVCLCVSMFVCLSVRVSVCMSLCIMYICMLSLLS